MPAYDVILNIDHSYTIQADSEGEAIDKATAMQEAGDQGEQVVVDVSADRLLDPVDLDGDAEDD
jgi:hypothetical protein